MISRRTSKSRLAIIDIAKDMPPLYHKLPDEEFDYRKSRTLWWLVKQPSVLKYIWDIVKQSGSVVYDAKTGKWKGINFESDEFD